jgi:hypothetical protein
MLANMLRSWHGNRASRAPPAEAVLHPLEPGARAVRRREGRHLRPERVHEMPEELPRAWPWFVKSFRRRLVDISLVILHT